MVSVTGSSSSSEKAAASRWIVNVGPKEFWPSERAWRTSVSRSFEGLSFALVVDGGPAGVEGTDGEGEDVLSKLKRQEHERKRCCVSCQIQDSGC